MKRYAIYFAPRADDPLWAFGCSVLGYDAARGVRVSFPDHPLLRGLLKFGYAKVAKELLEERREASFPPFAFLALLRSEAKTSAAAAPKAATNGCRSIRSFCI